MDPQTLPHRLTATAAHAALTAGTLTATAYAQNLLTHIAHRNPQTKAWAHLSPETVLAQARALDALPPAQRGPLHGIPIAVKDVLYTFDQPTSHGSALYANSQPAVDAGSVQILRNAGALVLGKTSTTEFAAVTEGPSQQTANPHALSLGQTRTPGGSSSGSGAVVADFQAPLALGTQTGGSTIRPGSFNGVFAFKPTWNAITREGQKVYSLLLDTLGLYARCVEDLELLCKVLGVKDDVPALARVRGVLAGEGVKGARFAVCRTMVWEQAGPGTVAALERGVELLRARGAEVVELELGEGFQELPEWHKRILFCDGRVAFRAEYSDPETRKSLNPFLIDHVEEKWGYSRADYTRACDGVAALRPKFDKLAEEFTAVIAPSVPDEAPEGLEITGSAVFNSLWTALHVPVVNVPGFKGANGMPIGLSLVGARYRDESVLAVAKEVAKVWGEEGGWKNGL
ncbi:hypothetical protein MBLNU230_g5174t1 [Neophaeotheca triangularis]